MKKSFFFAAVAAMFVVSCKQVEIDSEAGKTDEGQIEAGEGQTVIGAVIVDSKTVLGTPEENVYPVNWQEGDAICVNSVTSRALTAADFDGMSARFTFDAALEPPYKAVYPASAVVAASATGVSVKVPMAQRYTAGSFDPDAAIMLGTGSPDVTFINAMSFIKVKTTGSDKIAQVMVTSLGTEPMSGDFKSTDFAALEPDTDKNTFSSVVVVAETPVDAGTDIIAAIPTQAYASGFMITIQTPDGKIFQKKSTKAFNPQSGHMYAVTLAYAPVAPVATLTIDGDVTDWATVPAVTYTLPKGDVRYTALRTLKLTSDDKFVYAYMEIDEPGYSFSMPCDFFVDKDGNVSTGGKLTSTDNHETKLPYTDSGLEWYIEGSLHGASSYSHFASDFNAYEYMGKDGEGIFSGTTSRYGEYGDAQFEGKGSIDGNNIGRVEFKMARDYFGLTGKKMSMGIKLMDGANDWNCYGLLPQGVKGQDGKAGAVSMAALAMEKSSDMPPVLTEPISIDGDFSDWATAEGVQTYTLPEGALLSGAYEMKYVASEDYLYVYLDAMDNTDAKKTGGVTLDFYIDSDANPLTGMFLNNQLGMQEGSLFTTSGIDWYMQSNLYSVLNHFDLVNPGYFMECTGGFGKRYGVATVVQRGNHGTKEATSDKTYAKSISTDDGHILLEWKLSREFLKMTGPQARFGVRYMCPGTTNVGVMPQKPAEDGRFIAADMFTVNLPSKETPKPAVVEPIEIDGSFEDWDEAEGVATYDVPEDALYDKVYTMKAVASERYLYIYINAMDDDDAVAGNRRTRGFLNLNSDGDINTGFKYKQGSSTVLFTGGDWLIDTRFTQNSTLYNQTLFELDGTSEKPAVAVNEWIGTDGDDYAVSEGVKTISHFSEVNMNVSYGRVIKTGGDILVEWRLDRKFFGITGTKVGLGLRFYFMNDCVGVCPQLAKDGNGKFQKDDWVFDIPAIAE